MAGSVGGFGFEVDTYDALLAAVRARFAAQVAAAGPRPALLVTGATGLFARFLDALPPGIRPSQTCSTCRAFVERFGAAVRIDDDGALHAALWEPETTPAPYVEAIRALAKAVTDAPVVGVLVSSAGTWGEPRKGARGDEAWTHLSVSPPAALIYTGKIKTAGQAAAERREDRDILARGLAEFSPALVKQAIALLKTDQLYRSEKCLGVAEWLLDVHHQRERVRKDRRENVVWRAAATAPPGFCHVRSTMIGTLLEDLASGMAFDAVKTRFAAKMHPLQYQRPTAAPSAQNIARAEAIVAELASAGSLQRRFATLDDIVATWKPTPASPPAEAGGVFAHLKPRAKSSAVELDTPPTVMTWDKFARTVLPGAARITYHVPDKRQSYLALVTAANPSAPPILQWDSPARRNPVSMYVYVNGSLPADWNLRVGADHVVTAISLAPPHWYGDGPSHHNEFALFILEGARDVRYASGAGFFPEFLRSDYHEIRKTIEAYAKSAIVAGKDEASACGLVLNKGATWGHTFRVTSKDNVTQSYTLDRWD